MKHLLFKVKGVIVSGYVPYLRAMNHKWNNVVFYTELSTK